MPLENGYGFYRGTLTNFFPDTPENQGNYFHINLRVQVNGAEYQGPVDVDSKSSAVGVEWRVVIIQKSEITGLLAKGVGEHSLTSNASSGAIDYIRSPMFAGRVGCATIILALLGKVFEIGTTWKKGNNQDAYAALKPLLQANLNKPGGIMVFGEPYDDGDKGTHNVHQNQGDPVAGKWGPANGTWQDGCVMMEVDASTWVVFMNKFSTQSYKTDDSGDPA